MSTTRTLRPGLPPLPEGWHRLPIDERGYPVPYFVAWLDEAGNPMPRGEGAPDFRVIYPGAVEECFARGRCWLCGRHMTAYRAFVIGPMCAVNRTSAEPPSHVACAMYAAISCPFLTRPHMKRNEKSVAEGLGVEDMEKPAGMMLTRNPGVALVWVTKRYTRHRAPGGWLFEIGEPESVGWFCEARKATRAEVMASIDSGLPALREMCRRPSDTEALDREVERAMTLVPA